MAMDIKKMMEIQKRATKLMKEGESSLKTHIFKWKPNYLQGQSKFMEAAPMFETIGENDNAIKCYEQLAKCYEQLDDLHGAADSLQKVGFIIANKKKDMKLAYNYLMRSVNLFQIHGNPLKAQEMLKKLGKRCFEVKQDDLGMEIYTSIINNLFDEENYGTGAEVIPEYLNFLLDKDQYGAAIKVHESHIKYLQSIKKYEHLVARGWLGILCIHILMGEFTVADDKLAIFGSQISRPMSSDEYVAALNLTDAIQKNDHEMFLKTLRKPIFTQVEASLLRKLKKFSMPRLEEVKKAENPLFGALGKLKNKEEDKTPLVDVNPPKEDQKEADANLAAATGELSVEDKPEQNPEEKKESKSEEKEADYGGIFT